MIRLMTIILSLSYLFPVLAQQGSIEGSIRDIENKKVLIGANIVLEPLQFGAVSNQQGNFTFTAIPGGMYRLVVSYIGYETQVKKLIVRDGATVQIAIQMTPMVVPLREISVTSMRYQRKLQELAHPIAIMPEQRLMEINPMDVSQAIQHEPGVALARDGIWGTHISIRGLARNNIVTLVDGNRIDTATDLAAGLSMIDIHDVKQIEVIKGAFSSLYGTGAVGGVINVITKDGYYGDSFYWRSALRSGYQSVNNSGAGAFALSLGSRSWYVRLNGMNRKADDVTTPLGIMPNSQFQDQNYAFRAGLKPFEKHEIKINIQNYRSSDVGIPGGYPLFTVTADVRYPQEKRELYSLEYQFKNVLPHLAKISTKIFYQDILRDVENIPYLVNKVPGSGTQPPRNISVIKITPRATHKTMGGQFQSDWIFAGNNYLIFGLDAWQKDLNSNRERYLRIDVLDPATGSINKSTLQTIGEKPIPVASYRSIGLYLQDEAKFWRDKLTVTLGGRWDVISVQNERTVNPVYTITENVRNNKPSNQKVLWQAERAGDHSWSTNTGLLYHLTRELDLTVTLGNSFRSPYLEERFQYIDLGNLVKIGNADLAPERGTFTDLGVRFWGKKYTFTGNIFYNRLKNLVVETPGTFEGRNALIKNNLGSAELYGFDARTDWFLARQASLYGTIAFVQGQDKFLNEPLPLIAPWNGSLGIKWNQRQWFSLELLATLFSKQHRVANWELKTPGYHYLNLYLHSKSFKIGSLNSHFLLGIENMTNRTFRNHLSTNRGAIAVEPGRNFTLYLGLEY